MINGHDYVYLGLSVLWATCNVGAAALSGERLDSGVWTRRFDEEEVLFDVL